MSTLRTNVLQNLDSSITIPLDALAPIDANPSLLVDTQNLFNKTDPSLGASLVGFKRSALSTAIETVGGMLNAQWVNVWEYASLVTDKPTPNDPSTWDWQPAIQAMCTSGAAVGWFPDIVGNKYKTKSPVLVDKPIRLMSTKALRLGETVGVAIDNIGTGDTLVYSNTLAIYDAGIENLGLYSTTGHSLNLKYGTTRCLYKNLYVYTRAVNRSCVAMLYNTGVAGVDFVGSYSNVFEGGEYIVDKVARTAPNLDMLATGTFINENQFRNLWVSNATGRPAIRLMATAAGQLLSSNRFDGVIAEYCGGGVILLQATDRTVINNLTAWDQPAGYVTTLIQVSNDNTVMANRGLSIRNFARKGLDPLLGGVFDIDLGNSVDTELVNITTLAAANPVIEARNRSGELVGNINGTINNAGGLTRIAGGGITVNSATITTALAHTGTTAGFFGKTPVTQPSATADTTGATLAQLESVVNGLKQKLRDLGLMAT